MRTVRDKREAPLTPEERLKFLPFVPSHSSGPLGWAGVRVEHFYQSGNDIDQPPLTDDFLVLQGPATPLRGRIECGDSRLVGEWGEGAVAVVPAGAGGRFQWDGTGGATHFQLARPAVERIAQEACDRDPSGVRFRPVSYGPVDPAIPAVLALLRDELFSGGAGGRLCAESLLNVLVVHLLRHLAGGPEVRGTTGVLARRVVKAVEEFVAENLAASLSLADLAAVAHLSEYHFARLFRQTTGRTPHQFVIARRVERARQLLGDGRLSLAQVAAEVGFADQSHLTRHFRRLVGVTPGQFN